MATSSLDKRLAEIKAQAEPCRKHFSIDVAAKAVDREKRQVKWTITTGAVDRDNDIVNPRGWDVANFLKSPSILWAHDYSQPPVARAISLNATGAGLDSIAQFPPKGMYPFADTIFELTAEGFINATSVGFRPKVANPNVQRGGIDFEEQELLEYSVVPVPANAEALIHYAKSAVGKNIDMRAITEWAAKTLKAMHACPNCGADLSGENPMCDRCMGSNPPKTSGPRMKRAASQPLAAKHLTFPDDPVRWNRQLSKAFDVEGEPLSPTSHELAMVARFLETPVHRIVSATDLVPSARMGSYLSALDESLGEWKVEALRNIAANGTEQPPKIETIQLNSRTSRGFTVEGTRFLRRVGDNVKMVQKLEPCWMGLYVTHYIETDRADVRDKFLQRVSHRATELNFLKGEAFTLSGEFLDRGELTWPDLFMPVDKEGTLRRTVERINTLGESMESRGLLMMGPPGTGKTLSGRVMMNEADTTFVWISARDFYRAGAFGAFTYAFDIAAECAPCILFFEDVDNWLGPDTIDLLKTEMDGIKRRKGVLTVLTTNFPELLPEALIDRPGRFHDLVEMALPSEEVRARMIKAWMPEISPQMVASTAKETDGFSGAHIREMCSFARTLSSEDAAVGLDGSVARALAKIKEQRDLVSSLHNDYRPRRQIRSLVATTKAAVEKRGRVLSAANEGLIRIAQRASLAASDHMQSVLAKLEQAPLTEDGEDDEDLPDEKGLAIVFRGESNDNEMVLRILPDEDPRYSAEEVAGLLRESFSAALASAVQQEVSFAMAQARGRVD